MTYDFKATLKSGYVECFASGDNSASNVKRFLEDVLNACIQNNCAFALLEDNFSGPSLHFAEIYLIIAEASQKTWPHVKRIAFMDANPEHQEEKMRFAETVARNRGVLVQFFTDREEAIRWLQHP